MTRMGKSRSGAIGVGLVMLACSEQAATNPLLVAGYGPAVSGGSGGAGGTSNNGGGGGAMPPMKTSATLATGEWMLLGFEHAVTVSLSQRAGKDRLVLGGAGCVAGPFYRDDCVAPAGVLDDCGLLSGVGHEGSVSFSIDFSTKATYAADLYVEAYGRRMVGAFSLGPLGAPALFNEALPWIPLSVVGHDCLPFVPPSTPDLSAIADLATLNGEYSLQGREPLGWLEPGQPYRLIAGKSDLHYVIGGRFGAFWSADLQWIPESRTLKAGPVEPTIPGMPVELLAHFDEDDVVSDLMVTLADGQTGVVLPVAAK